MALDAGSVYATLGGRFNPDAFVRFDRAMLAAEGRSTKFEQAFTRSADRSHESAKRFATGAAKVGAVGVLGFGYAIYKAVDAAADFQAELSSLQSVTGATGGAMDKLKKQAMDAGAQTKYSALEAAQAQTALAKGGLSTAKILGGGLQGALALAAAGELELADAADYTANALNLFGLGGDHAGHVADALASAANSTTADVGDFGIALTQAGGAAKGAGLDFDQTIAALEALARIGVKGSDAGTSLKNAIAQIASPTKESAAEADKLGLSFFNAQGQMRPLTTISAQLRDKLGGLTKEQRLNAVTTIAGRDGYRALLALYDAGPSKIRRYEEQLAKQGTAAEVAAKKQDNLKGKIENLQGSIETAAITVGTELIPILERGAEQLTDFINTAAKNGDIKRFGEDVADGLQTAIEHVPDVVHSIEDIGETAADIYRTVEPLVKLIASVDPHVLVGAAAGLGAFRVAQSVVPGVMALGRGVATLGIAARTAPSLAAFGADIVAMLGPAGLAVGGLVALGAAIAVLSQHESDESRVAKQFADAKRDQAQATRDAQQAILDSAGAGLAEKSARLDNKRSHEELEQARKDYHAGKISLGQYKAAQFDAAQASLRVQQAHQANSAAIQHETSVLSKNVSESKKRRDAAAQEISELQKKLDIQTRVDNPSTGKSTHIAANANPETVRALATAQKALNEENGDYIKKLAIQKTAAASRDRLMQQSTAITEDNASGVSKLIQALDGVPAKKQAKLLVDNQSALADAGELASTLQKKFGKPTITTILSKTDSARAAVQAFKALQAGVPAKKVTTIISNASTAAGQVQGLHNAINALPTSHTTTFFNKTVNSSSGDAAQRGGAKRAAGRGPIGSERALVGEGRDPREAVIDGNTGRGFVTTGPMLLDLGPRDYVIPYDPAQRGGAMGLFMALARDLGVAGFKKGRKPPSYAVPKKISEGGVPFDDVKQRFDTAKSKADSAHDAETSAHKTVGTQRHRLDRVPSGKTHDRERANARDALDQAKKKETSAKAKAKRTADILAKAKTDFESARQFDVKIRQHESQINVLRDEMELAAKNKDSTTFAAKKSTRATKLTELRALLEQARHAGAGGDYLRQLNEQIAGLDVDAKSNDAEAIASDPPPDPEAYSDAEQSRLNQLEASLALERMSPDAYAGTEKDWLEQIKAVEQGALGRAQAAGASTLIKQIADDIRGTQNDLASLTTAPGQDPDVQAQLAQSQERERFANERARIAEDFTSVFAGAAGDLGFGSSPVVHQTFQMLHPGSPEAQRAVGDAATAGMSLQGARRSNRKVI